MKYRKRPVVIEAFQMTYEMARSKELDPKWFAQACLDGIVKPFVTEKIQGSQYCEIKTLEGTMVADGNDYIIQGVNGEIYPCKPDIFAKTYEPVDDEAY
jgi:hypothetical protein